MPNKTKFKIGQTFRIPKGVKSNPKCHIVAVVDEIQVVYKWYGKHRQWWHYEVEEADHLEALIKMYKENS